MNLNQIGLVTYRVALIAAVGFVAATLRQLGPELRNLRVHVQGDVSSDVRLDDSLNVNVRELAPVDFVKGAFSGSGTLETEADLHPGALMAAGPLEIDLQKDTFLTSGLSSELQLAR